MVQVLRSPIWCQSAVDLQPFLGAFLAAADLVAHGGIEDFRAAAGERAEARRAQDFQCLADRLLRDALGQVPDFDGGERLDGEIGAGLAHAANHVGVVRERQLGVESADDVDLGRALGVGLDDLAHHVVHLVGELAFLLVRAAGEGAELTAQDADVGIVEVKIEDVGRDVAVLALADVIGEIAERVEVLDVVEAEGLGVGQALVGEDFFRDVGEAGAGHDGGP